MTVSFEECQEMLVLQAKTSSPMSEIAEQFDCSYSTVAYHARGHCQCSPEDGSEAPERGYEKSTECPFCGEVVPELPRHLPCGESP